MTASGCFGGSDYEPIDTAAEVAAVVDELQQKEGNEVTDAATAEEYMLTVQSLSRVAAEYARRIRLITWTVVAIVVYLVLKEANK